MTVYFSNVTGSRLSPLKILVPAYSLWFCSSFWEEMGSVQLFGCGREDRLNHLSNFEVNPCLLSPLKKVYVPSTRLPPLLCLFQLPFPDAILYPDDVSGEKRLRILGMLAVYGHKWGLWKGQQQGTFFFLKISSGKKVLENVCKLKKDRGKTKGWVSSLNISKCFLYLIPTLSSSIIFQADFLAPSLSLEIQCFCSHSCPFPNVHSLADFSSGLTGWATRSAIYSEKLTSMEILWALTGTAWASMLFPFGA